MDVPVENTMVRSVDSVGHFFPLVSVDLEYHGAWCAFTSARISVSCVVRKCSIED